MCNVAWSYLRGWRINKVRACGKGDFCRMRVATEDAYAGRVVVLMLRRVTQSFAISFQEKNTAQSAVDRRRRVVAGMTLACGRGNLALSFSGRSTCCDAAGSSSPPCGGTLPYQRSGCRDLQLCRRVDVFVCFA